MAAYYSLSGPLRNEFLCHDFIVAVVHTPDFNNCIGIIFIVMFFNFLPEELPVRFGNDSAFLVMASIQKNNFSCRGQPVFITVRYGNLSVTPNKNKTCLFAPSFYACICCKGG